MNPINVKTSSMDELLQHLVRLSFDEANTKTIKHQVLSELSLRLASMAPPVPGVGSAVVQQAAAMAPPTHDHNIHAPVETAIAALAASSSTSSAS